MDPIAQLAQKRGEENEKEKKARARAKNASLPILSPSLLKWGLIVALVALFAAGILIQFDRNRSTGGYDPAAEMRAEMGLMDAEGNTFVPTSKFDQLLGQLGSSDPELRITVLGALVEENKSGAIPILRKFLADPEPRVRSRAAELLGQNPTRGYATTLLPLLTDADPGVRASAASALASYSDDPGVLYLLSTPLGSSDPAVVLNALTVWAAFSRKDESGASRAIGEAFRSSDEQVVTAAMQAACTGLSTSSLQSLRGEFENVKSRWAGQNPGMDAERRLTWIDAQVSAGN